jgi:hypothetical protein
VLLGIAGLVFGVYSANESAKLKELNRAQAWSTYQAINLAGGANQSSLKLYRSVHKENLDPSVVELMSQGYARSAQTLSEAIGLIQRSEPNFNCEKVNHWVSIGKIRKSHYLNFIELMVTDEDCTANKSIKQD